MKMTKRQKKKYAIKIATDLFDKVTSPSFDIVIPVAYAVISILSIMLVTAVSMVIIKLI